MVFISDFWLRAPSLGGFPKYSGFVFVLLIMVILGPSRGRGRVGVGWGWVLVAGGANLVIRGMDLSGSTPHPSPSLPRRGEGLKVQSAMAHDLINPEHVRGPS